MSKFQKGDRVMWDKHPGDAGTVRISEGDVIQVWWDNGNLVQYEKASNHALISLVARIDNPGDQFCKHGGVLAGKHCPICLKEAR